MKNIYDVLFSLPPFKHLKNSRHKKIALCILMAAVTSIILFNIVSADNILGDAGNTLLDSGFNFNALTRYSSNKVFSVKTIINVIAKRTAPVSNLLEPIGSGIAIVLFIYGLLDYISSSQFTVDGFMKKFLAMCITLVVISNSTVMMKDIPTFAIEMETIMTKQMTSDSAENKTNAKVIKDVKQKWTKLTKLELSITSIVTFIPRIILAALLLVVLLVLFLVDELCGILIFITKASIAIELGVRGLLMPLFFSNISADNMTRGLTDAVKKYMACAFQFIVLGATVNIGQAVCFAMTKGISEAGKSISGTDGWGVITILLTSILITGLHILVVKSASKTGEISRDIFRSTV